MKKMLILGGTGGLGRNMTELLSEKYKVTSVGSKDLDITDFTQLQDYFNNNQFDIVLNFSGYNYDSFLHKYNNETIKKAEKQISVNVQGSVNLLVACLPSMRKNKYGRIILLSSVLSRSPIAGTSIYSASKSFIDSLARTTTLENLSKGITCNSIQLGYFDAGLAHRIPEHIREAIINKIPLKRFGNMIELFNTIEYLINTEYMAGASISINGGISV